jgi:D-amino-acid oxidase
VFGVKYLTLCINGPRYLEYLLKTVQKLEAKEIKAKLQVKGGPEGVIRDTKITLLKDENVKDNVFALISCTGLDT